jgi:caffeoyl-CoA O-methyltransferase
LKTLQGPFDLVFLDADKPGYIDYLEWALDHVRPGGLIMAHNPFQHGNLVLQEPDPSRLDYTRAMDAFNRRVAAEKRLLSTIIPVGDGLVVAMVQ